MKRISDWENEFRTKIDKSVEIDFLAFEEVQSTMDVARELTEHSKDSKNKLVICKTQSRGRGRQGRVWNASESGLYCTYVFQWEKSVSELSGFSLAVGCSVAKTLSTLGAKVYLKWPNDLISGSGAKLGGILIEVHTVNSTYTKVLVGIGVNLIGTPKEVEYSTSVELLSEKLVSPVDLAILLTPNLFTDFNLFAKNGFSVFKERWIKFTNMIGRDISVDIGGEIVSGEVMDISSGGGLLLSKNGRIMEVLSGHVVSF